MLSFVLPIVHVALVILAAIVLILSGFLFLEILASFFNRSTQDSRIISSARPDLWQNIAVAVLIPAHNEEWMIGATLATLQPQLKEHDRLIVIADHCEDATAAIAQQAGATVIERQDSADRGKGYALDYGLNFLAHDPTQGPPAVVVMVDADCQVEGGTIATLASLAWATQRPIQSVYLMEKPDQPTLKDRVAAFAFKVKNQMRAGGLMALGMPCLLTGTGMAFPWQAIRAIDLATGSIVEDMKLGLDLAIVGYSPLFCPTAQVTGKFPTNEAALLSQRTRWEHGHLHMLLTYVPRLLAEAWKQQRWDLAILALDLAIPPLSSLVLVGLGLTVVSIGVSLVSGFWLSTGLGIGAGILLGVAIFLAWLRVGRSDLPLQKLLAIPLYLLWKIPLYFRFLVRPQRQWVRTERDRTHSPKTK